MRKKLSTSARVTFPSLLRSTHRNACRSSLKEGYLIFALSDTIWTACESSRCIAQRFKIGAVFACFAKEKSAMPPDALLGRLLDATLEARVGQPVEQAEYDATSTFCIMRCSTKLLNFSYGIKPEASASKRL